MNIFKRNAFLKNKMLEGIYLLIFFPNLAILSSELKFFPFSKGTKKGIAMWADGKSERLPGADLQPVGCDHFKSRPVAHARASERIICARMKRNERTRFHSCATHLNFIHFDRHEPSRRYVIPVRLSLSICLSALWKPALRVDAIFLRTRCKKMSILHRKVDVNLNIAVFKSILRERKKYLNCILKNI